MDPLSDVLSFLKPRSQYCAGLDAAKDWSFAFPAHEGIKFTAILRGACWACVDGVDQPIRFHEGDCFLLNSGRHFVLASDPAMPPENSDAVMEAALRDGIAVHNGGSEVLLISGRFDFSSHHASKLLDALPPIIHVPRASGEAGVLRWSLDQLVSELRNPQPGGALVSVHLVHLMLVQVMRLHLANASGDAPTGWFRALSDRQISAAINAMHGDPSRRWTLGELANVAGMSRTIFAQRFRSLAGATAIDYLTRWRMLIAADRLRGGDEGIASIAFSLGYESESAFSTAFKRTMSMSPTQYRRQPRVVDTSE